MAQTRDTLVGIIKMRMGNYNNVAVDEHIKTELQLQQDVLEQEASLPWFLVKQADVACTAGSGLVPELTVDRGGVTCDFLAEYEEEYPSIYMTAEGYEKRVYIAKEDHNALYSGQTILGSTHYAVNTREAPAGRFEVMPAPTEDWHFVQSAYFADVPLDSDIANLWTKYAPDLLIAVVGVIISGQYTALEKFEAKFQRQEAAARLRMAKINTMKEEENLRRKLGD